MPPENASVYLEVTEPAKLESIQRALEEAGHTVHPKLGFRNPEQEYFTDNGINAAVVEVNEEPTHIPEDVPIVNIGPGGWGQKHDKIDIFSNQPIPDPEALQSLARAVTSI